MSDWSESYHIRTDEPDTTTQKLIEAGIAGFIFTPKNGWLTFVPYDPDGSPGNGAMTDDLIVATGKSVLNYNVEDVISWGFEFKTPNGVAKTEPWRPEFWFQFMFYWDLDDNVRDENGDFEFGDFDHAAFCRAIGRPDLEAKMKEIVQIIDLSEIDEEDDLDGFAPAWAFGEALGLPVYEYLSSDYVQSGPENFTQYGLREIGPHPTPPRGGQQPERASSAPQVDGIAGMLKGLFGRRK
jgi:hypothetical protein